MRNRRRMWRFLGGLRMWRLTRCYRRGSWRDRNWKSRGISEGRERSESKRRVNISSQAVKQSSSQAVVASLLLPFACPKKAGDGQFSLRSSCAPPVLRSSRPHLSCRNVILGTSTEALRKLPLSVVIRRHVVDPEYTVLVELHQRAVVLLLRR